MTPDGTIYVAPDGTYSASGNGERIGGWHLERESARTGRKVTQREFVLGLIEKALQAAETEAPAEGPMTPEERQEDTSEDPQQL